MHYASTTRKKTNFKDGSVPTFWSKASLLTVIKKYTEMRSGRVVMVHKFVGLNAICASRHNALCQPSRKKRFLFL